MEFTITMIQLAEKKIRIGKATIGLIGLDNAMTQARERHLDEDAALDFIYETVSRNNYIPSSAVETYKKALRSEYRRLISGNEPTSSELIIKILGPGCVSCNKLNTMIFDVMQRLNIAADIEQIHDLDEIWRHGVISTPALIINGRIKCSGRMPTPADVEKWLVETADD